MTQLLVIAAIIGIVIAYGWLKRRAPGKQRALLTQFAAIAGSAIFLVLLIRGFNPLIAFIAGLLPAAYTVLRLFGTIRQVREIAEGAGIGSSRRGTHRFTQQSSDTIRLFECKGGGPTDGEVLRGAYQGKRLSSLSQTELLSILAECTANDPRAASLLAMYMKSHSSHSDGRSSQTPTQDEVEESLLLLGLPPTASADDVLRSHKRLMQRVHPDVGGSDYLAAKINRARQVLLAWIGSPATESN